MTATMSQVFTQLGQVQVLKLSGFLSRFVVVALLATTVCWLPSRWRWLSPSVPSRTCSVVVLGQRGETLLHIQANEKRSDLQSMSRAEDILNTNSHSNGNTNGHSNTNGNLKGSNFVFRPDIKPTQTTASARQHKYKMQSDMHRRQRAIAAYERYHNNNQTRHHHNNLRTFNIPSDGRSKPASQAGTSTSIERGTVTPYSGTSSKRTVSVLTTDLKSMSQRVAAVSVHSEIDLLQSSTNVQKLVELLAARSVDSTIVLTMGNSAYQSLVLVWCQRMAAINVHNTLVLVTDSHMMSFCLRHGLPCYYSLEYSLINEDIKFTHSQFHSIGRSKFSFLRSVLMLGYNVLFSELDVVWLRNPIAPYCQSSRSVTLQMTYTTTVNGTDNQLIRSLSDVKLGDSTITTANNSTQTRSQTVDFQSPWQYNAIACGKLFSQIRGNNMSNINSNSSDINVGRKRHRSHHSRVRIDSIVNFNSSTNTLANQTTGTNAAIVESPNVFRPECLVDLHKFDLQIQLSDVNYTRAKLGTQMNIGFFYMRATNHSIRLIDQTLHAVNVQSMWDQEGLSRSLWMKPYLIVSYDSLIHGGPVEAVYNKKGRIDMVDWNKRRKRGTEMPAEMRMSITRQPRDFRLRVLDVLHFPTRGVHMEYPGYKDLQYAGCLSPVIMHCTGVTGVAAKEACISDMIRDYQPLRVVSEH